MSKTEFPDTKKTMPWGDFNRDRPCTSGTTTPRDTGTVDPTRNFTLPGAGTPDVPVNTITKDK